MKKIIIDTNFIISFVTDRNLDQQSKTAELFESASKLQISIICHINVITEFIYVIDKIYQVDKKEISNIISKLLLMAGIELVCDVNIKKVLSYWPKHISDYGDAQLASLCSKTKNSSIATFDKKFLKELERLSLPIYPY